MVFTLTVAAFATCIVSHYVAAQSFSCPLSRMMVCTLVSILSRVRKYHQDGAKCNTTANRLVYSDYVSLRRLT